MTATAQSSLKKMSWARGQSSGWAAFDVKQRSKNNQSEVDKDPFPPIGTSDSAQHGDKIVKKNHLPLKPFSSVLFPSNNFPSLKEGRDNGKALLGSDSSGKYCGVTIQEDVHLPIKKLKEQHLWAEDSLIEDVLAAVNNDIDKASALLGTMACNVNFEKCEVSSDLRQTTLDDIPREETTDGILALEKVKDDIALHSNLVGNLQDNDQYLEDGNASSGQKLSDIDNLRYKVDLLNFVPVEPEWEDDDLYIRHRKEALKTMRSASRHYKAASSAFLRGDRYSAQQHSIKAQEEWHTARKLNSEAAKKIVSIRNSENDIWRLDLHGLHAAEAIQALLEHLFRIENQAFSKSSATSNGVKENGLAHSTVGPLNFTDRGNLDKQAPFRARPFTLEVITGIGNHSRGQAALPTAVRSFLNENRYRFEETRPGVITVWPKFRHS